MSELIRVLKMNDARLRQTETKETAALYLPWSQRILNPFPLASSGVVWGDLPQPWPVNVLTFACSVYVVTTNNGANYWTLSLVNSVASALASVSTAAIAANAATRLSTATITQPSSANQNFGIIATATGSPGAIYIWPSVALLRI